MGGGGCTGVIDFVLLSGKNVGKVGEIMARCNAMEEDFMEITVLGKPALFTSLRIAQETVPEGLYLYEVREDDYGRGDPVQIAKGILVNHFGSIITCEPIALPADGCLNIDPETDWNFEGGYPLTITEFLGKKG